MSFAMLSDGNSVITRERIEEFFDATTDDDSAENSERNPIWEEMRAEFGSTEPDTGVITKE